MSGVRRLLRPRLVLAVVLAVVVLWGVPGALSGVPVGAIPVDPGPLSTLAGAPVPDPDPGALGPEPVVELSYDLGALAFRPVDFPTAVELRAKVYAPETIVGRAPVVIIQHGRHVTCSDGGDAVTLEWPCPAPMVEVASYQGYDALGRLLASRGMIAVSIGANAINAIDDYVEDSGARARGELVLEHLRRWRGWDQAPSAPFGDRFVGHVDLTRVGLVGHSRGGEGVVVAAELNQRLGSPYGIQAVVALAPVDFARRVLGGVPLQVVLPYCDGDVSDLQGLGYYDDGRDGTPGDLSAKQTTLLHGANHNFFNTVWTSGPGAFDDASWGLAESADDGGDGCAAAGPGRLTGPQQVAAGATIMGGFLQRFVTDDLALQPFVTGVAAYPPSSGPARWSVAYQGGDRLEVGRWGRGDDARLNRLGRPATVRSASPELVCAEGWSFSGPVRGVPCTEVAALANTTGALDVGWVAPSVVARGELDPAGTDVTAYDGVRFRIGFPADPRNDRRGRQDASVRLVDASGATSSVAVGRWSSAFARRPISAVQHTVLNGVRVPLSAFSGVDLTRIVAVEVRFDRTYGGRALLSDLAFSAEGTGDRVGPAEGAATPAPVIDVCRSSEARRWACAVTWLAWGRRPSEAEARSLAASFGTASQASRVTAAVTDAIALQQALTSRSQALYGDAHSPERLTLAGFTAGGSWENTLVALAAEVQGVSGTTAAPDAVVTALYVGLVGRLPDAAGLAHWTPIVAAGGLPALARALVGSEERATKVLDERFRQIVGRAPDAGARAYWVPRLRVDGGERALVGTLLRSAEMTAVALR